MERYGMSSPTGGDSGEGLGGEISDI